MTSVLAIDTATDACSVAWVSPAGEQQLTKTLPRAHNRHLLAMVDEILAGASLTTLTHLVCGEGPGSFTGLRIAAATVQGLAWPHSLPVAPYCSLRAQAEALGPLDGWVLSTIDAQIDQLYGRWFVWREGALHATADPWISRPEEIPLPEGWGEGAVHLLGSGDHYRDRLPVGDVLVSCRPDARPNALAMAQRVYANPEAIDWMTAPALSPRYVQEDIGWKKLAEQGRRD